MLDHSHCSYHLFTNQLLWQKKILQSRKSLIIRRQTPRKEVKASNMKFSALGALFAVKDITSLKYFHLGLFFVFLKAFYTAFQPSGFFISTRRLGTSVSEK